MLLILALVVPCIISYTDSVVMKNSNPNSDNNNVGTFAIGMGLIWITFYTSTIQSILSFVLSSVLFILKYLFLDWVTISNTDSDSRGAYNWLIYFLVLQKKKGRLYTKNVGIETAYSIKKMWYNPNKDDNTAQIRLLPLSWGILIYKRKIMILHISLRTPSVKYTYYHNNSPVAGKHITLYIPFKFLYKSNFFQEFIRNIQKQYNNKIIKRQPIYKINSSNSSNWVDPILTKRLKLDDGNYILTPAMKSIVDGIKIFLDPETRQKYKKKGWDYCHKICVHGPPGTGKSKLITRIAGEHNLPMYYFSCEQMSGKLRSNFDKIQSGIIVIEEIDRCISYSLNKKSKEIVDDENNDQQNEKKAKQAPTITEWHDVLDKILGSKVIVYMTTNNYDTLKKINHGSIIRAERVDQIVYMGTLTKKDINKILQKNFDSEEIYIGEELGDETNLTPADIINIIKISNDDIDKIKKLIVERNTEKGES